MLIKNNKLYDVLKWIVITVLPAISTLIAGLGLLYNFDSVLITGTISLVTTFIGSLIGISSLQYNKTVNAVTAEQDTAVSESTNTDDGK